MLLHYNQEYSMVKYASFIGTLLCLFVFYFKLDVLHKVRLTQYSQQTVYAMRPNHGQHKFTLY
jgi:hypothetical protein